MNDVATAERTRRHIARDLGVDADFDVSDEIERRVAHLADAMTGTGTGVLVLAISGGIGSATAGRLCQLAVEQARGAEPKPSS
jgi:NAD+ synthase